MNKYINADIKIKTDNEQISHYEITDINRTLYEIHGQKYLNYRKEWDEITSFKVPFPKKPLYIVMETNSYCNMKCKMCIRNFDQSKNRKVDADVDLLKKVVCECKELGIPSFFIGAEAECLINPHIKDIIRMIKEEGCGIDNFLITNGYELNEDICNMLVDLQWERVYISLDAAFPETYEKIRGKDLKTVENNIENLLKIREGKKSMLPLIRVSFVIQEDNKAEKNAFIEKWKDKVDIIDFQNLIHYENMEINSTVSDIEYKCAYPFRTMLLDCDGNYYPCCTEFGYKMPIGNAKDMSVKEAWNSDFICKLRADMLDSKLNDVCRACASNIEFDR